MNYNERATTYALVGVQATKASTAITFAMWHSPFFPRIWAGNSVQLNSNSSTSNVLNI
jgi:hypothetical protein